MSDPFTWLVGKVLEARDARKDVRVLVHLAYFTHDKTAKPYYFIKVANLSPNSKFTITHIWVGDGKNKVNILNIQRPLPHKLEPSDTWETWIPKELVKEQKDVFKKFQVMLTDGKVYKSKKNTNVPSAGFVA